MPCPSSVSIILATAHPAAHLPTAPLAVGSKMQAVSLLNSPPAARFSLAPASAGGSRCSPRWPTNPALRGLLGIATAADFTEDLIWNQLNETAQNTMIDSGEYALPNDYCNDPLEDSDPYIITHQLIIEARNHLLLQGKNPSIALTCPIRLIHGMDDADVPPETSHDIMNALASTDVEVTYQKNGDHRMSSPESLALLERILHRPDKSRDALTPFMLKW